MPHPTFTEAHNAQLVSLAIDPLLAGGLDGSFDEDATGYAALTPFGLGDPYYTSATNAPPPAGLTSSVAPGALSTSDLFSDQTERFDLSCPVTSILLSSGEQVFLACPLNREPSGIAYDFCMPRDWSFEEMQNLITHIHHVQQDHMAVLSSATPSFEDQDAARSFGTTASNPPNTPAPRPIKSAKSRISPRKTPYPRPLKVKRKTDLGFELVDPLSKLAPQMQVTPVCMEAYVNRSSHERRARVDANRKTVPRPMNGFMLYRKAYTAAAKVFSEREANHSIISMLTGRSWRLETDEVKAYYLDLARVDSRMHALAFPDYKYKPGASKAAKRARTTEDDENESDQVSEEEYRPRPTQRRR